MSRHRNVRNLIAEDDYYDYDDDYDDYDDDYGGYTQPAAPKSKAKPKAKAKATATATSSNKPNSSNNNASQKQKQTSAKAKTTPATATTTTTTTTSGGLSVSKPPPGWGEPSAITPTATATPTATNAAAVGIVAPPPGWGKPSAVTGGEHTKQTSSSTTTSTSTTSQTKPKSIPVPVPVPSLLEKARSAGQESQLSMVVIGHVDAGKSTICGQLLYQVGLVSKRQAIKVSNAAIHNEDKKNTTASNNNNNNIQWAWLLDEDEGERARGVTMQIATKAFSTPSHPQVLILDAPGHADFVPTMITGAANADAGLLVVDASAESAFQAAFTRGGQTKEHILLARGLGVSQLVVCINKLDVQDWSQQVFENTKQRLLPFLTQQAGFAPKRIRFVPTSGLTGVNIMMMKAKNNNNNNNNNATALPPSLRQWYKGPSLYEAIDSFQPVKNTGLDGPLRIILSDVYAEGKGVAARGKVVQGFLESGEKLVVLPIGDDATVANLQHLHAFSDSVPEERHRYAVVGETVDLTLTGIDSVRVSTGSILSRPSVESRPPMKQKCRAKIVVMDDLTVPIIRGAQVLFHIHNLDIPANLTQLISMTKRGANGSTKNRPRAVTSSSTAVVEITLSEKICMEPFQSCRALGRFALRRSGHTIAVGIIEEVL